MTETCPFCKNEVPEGATVCANCHAYKGPNKSQIYKLISAVALGLAAVFLLGSGDEDMEMMGFAVALFSVGSAVWWWLDSKKSNDWKR